jgi:drug/metabolite transporter (DMT)-like permease
MNNQGKARHLIHMDASVAGPLLMLSAALLFTLLNVFVKLLGPAFTVWHIGFFRFFGGLVVLISVFGRHRNPYRGFNTRLLIIRGCVGSIAFISFITAIRLLPVSMALVIFYSFPAFSAVFSYLIYGEKIGKFEIACISVVVIGVGVLFDFQLAGGLLGQILALVASLFAGMTVTLIRSLREKNGPVVIYLYFCTMGAMITLPKFIMYPIFPSTSTEWVMILGIIFFSVSAQLLMNQGFFYCRGWEGGVFMSSEVIFTGVVGIVFMGDPATPRFWIGGLMIFGSVVALNRLKANGRQISGLSGNRQK